MVAITKYAEKRILAGKNKMKPSPEELNPNMKFVENRFILQLEENEQLLYFVENQKKTWDNEDDLVRALYEKIIASDYYQEYMANEYRSYTADRELWRKIYNNLIHNNPDLDSAFEEQSL